VALASTKAAAGYAFRKVVGCEWAAVNYSGAVTNILPPALARPVLLWLLVLLVAGCGRAPPAAAPSSAPNRLSAPESYWPTAGWRTSPPEATLIALFDTLHRFDQS